jgi:hypothetical protein
VITGRDLDLIGPAPARPGRPTRPQQAHPGDRPVRAAEVSAAATITVRGPCTRRVLEELTARIIALLEVGVRELVLDLSPVTDAGPRLPRAVRRLRQVISEHGGALTLAAAPSARVGPAPHTTTPAQALLTSRSPRHPLPPCPGGPIDQDPTDPDPTDPGPTDPGLTAAGPGRTS